jgi:hypothetical protein
MDDKNIKMANLLYYFIYKDNLNSKKIIDVIFDMLFGVKAEVKTESELWLK